VTVGFRTSLTDLAVMGALTFSALTGVLLHRLLPGRTTTSGADKRLAHTSGGNA
jgi:hypothetical protein